MLYFQSNEADLGSMQRTSERLFFVLFRFTAALLPLFTIHHCVHIRSSWLLQCNMGESSTHNSLGNCSNSIVILTVLGVVLREQVSCWWTLKFFFPNPNVYFDLVS